MGFRPCPVGAQRTQVDVLNVKGLMDTVRVGDRGDRPAYPGLDIHIFFQSRTHQAVPEVLIPLAILSYYLEGQSTD